MKLLRDYFVGLYAATIDGWNRFWFTPADPATLGLIRILAGALLTYTHLVWSVDLLGFLGPEGRLSLDLMRLHHASPFAWSYLEWISSPALLWTLHISALIVLVLFTLGVFTRVTSALAFLITVSYAHRAVGTLFGLDQINGLLALYLAIGPSGAAYSVDRWLGWTSRAGEGKDPHSEESVMANVAIRLLQVHMCVIYLFAGAGKLMGPSWWDGSAIWGALANYEYQTLDVTWIANYPWMINLLTHVTVAWELSYCALVWPRWTRPIVVALSVPLHLGIAVCMGMVEFGLAMSIGSVAFVAPEIVRPVFGVAPGTPAPPAAAKESVEAPAEVAVG